jgi:transcriptional regulator with XRE-family HTH domain
VRSFHSVHFLVNFVKIIWVMFLMEAVITKWQGIADRIAKILKERQWSQAELGRRANVPRSYVTRVMQVDPKGSPPTLRTLVAIETALQASVIEIAHSRIKELSE